MAIFYVVHNFVVSLQGDVDSSTGCQAPLFGQIILSKSLLSVYVCVCVLCATQSERTEKMRHLMYK